MKRDIFPLIFGVLATSLVSGTLVIAGLKAGITPGVSPLIILFAWGAFARAISAGGGTRFLNIAQVAGSAGMAVTAGVIFTAPLVQILYHDKGLEVPPVDVVTLMILSFSGALIGFGFVGLGTKKFLTDPTLPAPEARACETMIETAVSKPENRPRLGRSLYFGVVASFLAPYLVHLGAAKEHLVLLKKEQGDRAFQLDLPFTPIYIGIGGLLTLSTALLVFGGSMLRLLGDYGLADIAAGTQAALDYPANSMRWVGGGAMTVAVAYSLYRFMGVRTSGETVADPLVEVDARQRGLQRLSIAVGVIVMLGWLFVHDGATAFTFSMSASILVCCSLMVVLGAILSLQIGSSASPVSGTIFVTTLVLCLTALAVGRREISDVLLLTPLLVGACVAVCTANDSSQDYKTLQLCGMKVQDGFLAQFLGLMAGCIVVPIVLYIAHEAYTLGSEQLIAPQGKMFATLIEGLLLSKDTPLPWSPIAIGVAIGLAAVAMDVAGQRAGRQLPSMALAVGIYLPPYLGIGILIGALFRYFAERGKKQSNESILAAAGLITGAALLELILGVLIVGSSAMESYRENDPQATLPFGAQEFSFELEDLAQFATQEELDGLHLPAADPMHAAANEARAARLTPISETTQKAASVLGILVLGGVLWFNSRGRKPS